MAANPDSILTIEFTLNGESIEALQGETILQAAKRSGTEIPHLCYSDDLRADGNCRACVVEIDGEGVLAPSCCRNPSPGMVINSNNERAQKSQGAPVQAPARAQAQRESKGSFEATAVPRSPRSR